MVNHCSVRCSTRIDAQIRQHYLTYSRIAHLRQSYIKEPRHVYCKGEKDFIIVCMYNSQENYRGEVRINILLYKINILGVAEVPSAAVVCCGEEMDL